MKELLKITVKGTPDYIDVAKMGVGALASKLGFDVEKALDIEIAVGEACKITTCHENECWSASYTITCSFEDNQLSISVKDTGEGTIDKGGYRCCLDCPSEGDLGFHVIKSIMDLAVVENEGKEDAYILMKKEL